jgi:hypothetical protein
MTPNARSKSLLESDGFLVDIVQQRVTKFLTRDLFGIFDLVAVREGMTLAVQATTSDHAANRRRKVLTSPALTAVRAAGWTVEVHGWRKTRGRWQCKRETL